MFFVLPALASSLAYSTDAVIVRTALERMPLHVFIFILALLYTGVAAGLWLWPSSGAGIRRYLADGRRNGRTVALAVVGLVVGTVVADGLMYLAIQASSRTDLPLAVTLIHTAPLLSLLLVWVVYGKIPNWKVCAGIALSVVGCMIAVMFTDAAGIDALT